MGTTRPTPTTGTPRSSWSTSSQPARLRTAARRRRSRGLVNWASSASSRTPATPAPRSRRTPRARRDRRRGVRPGRRQRFEAPRDPPSRRRAGPDRGVPRTDVTEACVAALGEGDGGGGGGRGGRGGRKGDSADSAWYASHAWNPAFFEGTATVAYEIAFQRDWEAPDAVVTPLGHGTCFSAPTGVPSAEARGLDRRGSAAVRRAGGRDRADRPRAPRCGRGRPREASTRPPTGSRSPSRSGSGRSSMPSPTPTATPSRSRRQRPIGSSTDSTPRALHRADLRRRAGSAA